MPAATLITARNSLPFNTSHPYSTVRGQQKGKYMLFRVKNKFMRVTASQVTREKANNEDSS